MNKKEWNNEEQLEEKILDLVRPYGFKQEEVVKNSILELMRMAKHGPDSHDLETMNTSIEEVRKSFKTFLPYRDVRKVCLFGSARTAENNMNFILAEKFSELITQKGYMLITGAGNGIMEAGNKGSEKNMSFGVNIRLPFEQDANPYIVNDPKLVSFNYFFNRKVTFVKESDATVIFPGGFGTHDECFEVLTLLQTGRAMPRPVVLFAEPKSDYWVKWKDYIVVELMKKGYISEDDLNLFTIRNNVDEAIEDIISFYKVYHSIEYYDDITVMRLNRELNQTEIKELNNIFKDLLIDGEFQMKTSDQIKEDTGEFPDKPRLVFSFNKLSYGRLIRLINHLNHKL
jgi:uncharacterized protein (TIGR00730 family)